MICLSDPAQYRGNLHGCHTRPYIVLYLGPCDNCHHTQTSSTNSDQPSYYQSQSKQSTKHVHQDLNSPFQLLIYLRITYRNQILHPQSFAIDPYYNSKPWLIHQYNAKNIHVVIQFHITQLIKLEE